MNRILKYTELEAQEILNNMKPLNKIKI